ncbi:MAG: 50S ribosomal protein L17 [Candidatus Wolfebacteria bacterium]|nr:50S ribosomal protein L17 [Candidatus Wolfebacteria bacterium]
MRHLKKGRKFGRKKGQRRAFKNNLTTSLVRHGKITTTEARAKEIRGVVERLITYGKKQTIASLRLIMKELPKTEAYKVQKEIAPKYANRKGGYTRVIKHTKVRKGDAAKCATIEFV